MRLVHNSLHKEFVFIYSEGSCCCQVFQTSEGKGWGVRTLEALEKGTFVCEYVGEVVTNQELDERNEEFSGDRHTYPVLLDADWASERFLKDEEALCLDATKFGNVARFINHRYFCHTFESMLCTFILTKKDTYVLISFN